MSDIRKMQLGQVVDFCIAYNERHKEEEEDDSPRLATQADIDAYFG